MKNRRSLVALVAVLLVHPLYAQISFSANDAGAVPPYQAYFQYGTNMGYYGSSWDDNSLANIAAGDPGLGVAGVGSKSLRVTLPDYFVEAWGYDIRLSQFAHYSSIGIKANTIFLGEPSTAHLENVTYSGCGYASRLFKNMYEPIWDGGANGTPVNDNNDYALYVYKIVTRYKNNTHFWEIINEPDFAASGNGSLPPGQPNNWWENNPNPCELNNLNAPIFNYIRLLRISYEVIKYVDPSAYVAPGGLGYISFLDALLRNTDNPVDGSVTPEYPLKGGAYFDVLSFHSYPMYVLKYWDNALGGMRYLRYSDAAVDAYVNQKNEFDSVLHLHGYDGSTYPEKYFICTENNIPGKAFGTLIGSDEAQRNYIIKALVASQQNGIKQFYAFTLGNTSTAAAATDPYQLMGLYQKLEGIGPLYTGGIYNQQYTDEGVAFKTTSDLLLTYRYDATRTANMNLPSSVRGGAFTDSLGNHVYVLWAKTETDGSEAATASYSFPASMFVAPQMYLHQWDYSITGSVITIPSENISLTGSPIFLTENVQLVDLPDRDPLTPPAQKYRLSLYPSPASQQAILRFSLDQPAEVQVDLFNSNGQFIRAVQSARSFASGNHMLAIDNLSALPAGVYYCRFKTTYARIMKKLIVVH